MTTATAARALLLALAATAWPATAQEAQPFAAPGRAGAAPPAAADPVAGRPMRVGFAVPPGAAAPPAMFGLFLNRPAAAPAPCLDAARRLVATSGRGVGTRELTGPLVVAFGADATATVVDPALRLGPAGLAGLARLPGAPTRLALDPVGQRLFVASAAPPAMAIVDLATRRGGAVLSLDAPAAGIAWDAAGDALFVLAGDGALAAHDPETLQPRAASARIAGAEALAVVGRERLVAVAGAEAGLRILDAASLDPLHGLDLPAGGGAGAVRLAAAEDDAAVFVSSGRAAFAVEARSGRRLARFDLAVPAKALLPLLSGQAAAPLADGSVVVLDAAVGALLEVVPAGADVAEAALAGSTLYLRGEATPRLALLDAARLRPGRHPAPASAEAGARPFGPAALPLLAPFGEAMLVANPGERRIYLHHGMGMAAPRAAFAAGGSPLVAIAALAREPARTAAARVELTAEAPAAGRWRLVFALPEQGRAVCHDLFVAPGAPA